MREVAKSFFRLSWAMAVFGTDQLASLVRKEDEVQGAEGGEEGGNTEAESEGQVARAMDSVSSGAEKHFEKRARSVYEAGDKLQSEMIDLFFDSMKPDEWKPKKVFERAASWADRSADALRDLAADDDSDDEESERDREGSAN